MTDLLNQRGSDDIFWEYEIALSGILLGLAGGIALQGFAQRQDTTDPQAARQLVSFYDSALV